MRTIITLFAALGVLTASAVAQATATLRSGDMFEVRLSGVPVEHAAEFALLYTVGSDGTVNIPLIGDVKAEGTTATQLQKTIEGRLIAGKIFTHPTVIINIQNAARAVTVSGSGIRNSTRIAWANDLTLSTAISAAGGANEFAGDRVQLIRGGQVAMFSRKKLDRDPASDPKVLPGDHIKVL